MPHGYRKPRKILRLNKNIYGLRELSVLWQWLFIETLMNISFKLIFQEPCYLTCDEILIFFDVDDIVLAF